MRVPLGVIGFIYESRPNVTADAAGLCLKSGNAVLLRGGSEALESNTLHRRRSSAKAVEKAGLPPEVIQAVETAGPRRRSWPCSPWTATSTSSSRAAARSSCAWSRSARRCRCSSTTRASATSTSTTGPISTWPLAVAVNAKAQRVSVCNSLETLLVHAAIAPALPAPARRAPGRGSGVRCGPTSGRGPSCPARGPPSAADWDAEYLDYILAVRVVEDLDEAVAHIRRHGSGLAEAIVTRDVRRARRFTQEVDAAAVLVNASTRLVDGSQFGMGAEMGISTSRVHARGPVGVRELTTTKFVVWGDGHIRE